MMVMFCVMTLQFTPQRGSVSSSLESVLTQKTIKIRDIENVTLSAENTFYRVLKACRLTYTTLAL